MQGGPGGQQFPPGMMDPDMAPMDGMEPQEPENCMDYLLDLNPYRKTLEVFLMLSVLTTFIAVIFYSALSYVIVEYFFGSGGIFHVVETGLELCVDDACREYEHRTMGFVQWKSNPCDSYFHYACAGFEKEAVDLNFMSYEPFHEIIDIEYQIVMNSLFHQAPRTVAASLKIIDHHLVLYHAYSACRSTETWDYDVVRLFSKLLTVSSIGAMKAAGEGLYPMTPFATVTRRGATCYVDPPEFFAPIRLYEKESFEQEYLAAYHEYLTTNDIDDDDVLKNMLANFYATQKRIAEVSEDPRRRVHDPFKQTDNNAFFKVSAVLKLCNNTIWASKRLYEGIRDIVGNTSDQDLADYVALWVLQFASLGGVKASPLARIHYRYAALLNEPPSAERRCLDLMEPMMRDYMLATLRITHVFENEDVHETAKEKAQTAMKALVNHVKQFLAKSALAADDLSEAFSLLDKVKFEVFFPGDLSAREVDFIIPGLSTSAGIVVGIEAYTQGMLKSADAILNGLTGWPISTFAHEPLYIASLETMYVPYAVFAWAYMGSNSSLPFSIPVYGLKIVRELFKVFDYRSNWWVAKNGPTAAAYGDLESCVERLEALYRITDPVERYETIAEIAAVHVLYDMYVTWVQERKNDAVDVRVPFLKTVHSTTQFFVALASDMCARTNVTIRDELNTFHGVKTAEQRLEVLANHMPQFSAHFECKSSARMYTKKNYENCLFWKP